MTAHRSASRRLEQKLNEISQTLELTALPSGPRQQGRIHLQSPTHRPTKPHGLGFGAGDFDRDAVIRELRLWLQPPEEVEEELALQSSRQWPSTCTWLTDKKTYRQWASARTSSILWYHARPGAGKSVLASHLIRLYEDAAEVCTYFCFRYNIAILRSPQSLLRSFAFQMAERDIESCKQLFRLCEQGVKVLDSKVGVIWKRLFVDTLLKIRAERPVYWIIDALDECDVSERTIFLNFLTELSRSSSCFKTVILSRYCRDIATKLQQISVPAEEITTDENAADIRLFARERIERSPSLAGLAPRILPHIIDQSRGCFLWVCKTLDSLDERDSMEEILHTLAEIPPGMDELYNKILNDMAKTSTTQVTLARIILKWVLCVVRPLSVSEIDYIIDCLHGSVANTEVMIKNTCGQLVNVDKNQRVQLNHMTIQEYFTTVDVEPAFAICFPDVHAELASFCLEYLKTIEKDTLEILDEISGEALKEQYPLVEYASMYWSYHITCSQDSDILAQQISGFLRSSSFNSWLQILARCSNLEYMEITLANVVAWANLSCRSKLMSYFEDMKSLCEQLGFASNEYQGPRIGKLKHGFGVVQYANGDRYEGNWETDLRHGFGECIYADGAKYIGWWARDEYSGQGTFTSADGSQYVGNWVAGRKSGYGAMTWTWMERFNYQGDWKDDRPHGFGTMIFCFGTRYEGEWANGCEHGLGKVVYWNGTHFEGQFIDGDETGELVKGRALQIEAKQQESEGACWGVLKYASGGTYEGELESSGLPHGQGTWNAPTGFIWKGIFAEGLFHGPGVLHRRNGGAMRGVWQNQAANGEFEDINDAPGGGRYVGNFQDTTRHGEGTLESASGYIYKGQFRKNEMHGPGERRYRNGDHYIGESAHGSMHGKGRMVYVSSATYEGEWNNNKRQGSGTLVVPKSYKFSGIWSCDRAIGGTFEFL